MTKNEYQAFSFIESFRTSHGYCPSFDEIREALGLKSKSGVHRVIRQLESKGWIRTMHHRARAIEVLRQPLQEPASRPMVIGDLYPMESAL